MKNLLAAILPAILLTAACGGSAVPASSPATASSRAAGPASSAASASPAASLSAQTNPAASGGTAVKIAIAGSNIIESSAELANRDGNYQKHGIVATIARINGSVNTMAAMQSGEIQIAQSTSEAVLLGQTKGLPLLAIAAINSGFTQSLVMSNKWLQAHPLPSNPSLPQRAALLNGATLGQVSATDEIVVKNFLKLAGLPPTAAKFVKMQNQQAQLAALKQGEIDAISLSAPESFEAEHAGAGKIVLNSREIPKWDAAPYIVAFTTRQYAKDHPDAVKGVLAATEEAMAKMVAGGPAVLEFEKTVYPEYSAEVLQRSLDFVHLTPYQPMTAEMWQVEAQILLDGGQLTDPYTPKQGTDWTNDFLPAKPA